MTRHIIEQYEQAERFFWSNISIETKQIDDAEVFVSGAHNQFLNCVIQRRPLVSTGFENILKDILAFVIPHNIPWVWIIREDLIDTSLKTTPTLQLIDKSRIMHRYLDEPFTYHSPKLQILENNNDLRDWGFCLGKAYKSSTELSTQYSDAISQYINAHQKDTWGKTKFHHFVAYLNNAPVSCLTLSLQNAIARIDDVGTIPSQQNRGFATELMSYVLNYAKQLGADICFLESSQAGIKMYQRIGFNPLYTNGYYTIIEKVCP